MISATTILSPMSVMCIDGDFGKAMLYAAGRGRVSVDLCAHAPKAHLSTLHYRSVEARGLIIWCWVSRVT
jgi:hypothetical protein